ncbi:hypothetical protein [Natrinema ejinorense]|uniref:Uncharacterized protein n=1 Tax=Natrinema ejinorense TaxID=373386 RepID=A0A2A5QP63_9EURY|nr:hypothetical protein [Natrinema ejinorense]PCR88636.1 hypothetical protein CP557_21625 [Natrinema ejinorense]
MSGTERDRIELENGLYDRVDLRLQDVIHALNNDDPEGAIVNLHEAQNELLKKHPEIPRVHVTVPAPNIERTEDSDTERGETDE